MFLLKIPADLICMNILKQIEQVLQEKYAIYSNFDIPDLFGKERMIIFTRNLSQMYTVTTACRNNAEFVAF